MNKLIAIPFIVLIFIGCKDEIKERPCRYIPEDRSEKVSRYMEKCVAGSTAKQTGENQYAERFVRECMKSSLEIFGVDGFKKYLHNSAGGWAELSGCREIPDMIVEE